MQFQDWWEKYHGHYFNYRVDDVPPWTVKKIAREAWQDATHAEFMRRMDRELERSKEGENE